MFTRGCDDNTVLLSVKKIMLAFLYSEPDIIQEVLKNGHLFPMSAKKSPKIDQLREKK